MTIISVSPLDRTTISKQEIHKRHRRRLLPFLNLSSARANISAVYCLCLLFHFLFAADVLATDPSSIAPSVVTRTPSPLHPADSNGVLLEDALDMAVDDLRALNDETKKKSMSSIRFLFSDIDGTLVHYPDEQEGVNGNNMEKDEASRNTIIRLPPSSTGLQGIISSRTLALCRDLRQKYGVKVVLVSGARTSTLLTRLAFLPKADAYASEGGGRIFYPVDLNSMEGDGYNGFVVHPVKYDGASDDDGDGQKNNDLTPFGLREDMTWRTKMEETDAAGKDGYRGMDNEIRGISDDKKEAVVPVPEREGKLWEFAQTLLDRGFVIDSKGYSACFRVNRKHQTNGRITNEDFDSLSKMDLPIGLASSTNLGCVDFYPEDSGKKNCCSYLVKSMQSEPADQTDSCKSLTLPENAVCMCDDDNDLEMALACSHAYLPSVTSSSMAHTVRENEGKLTVTEDISKGLLETTATDEALRIILARVKEEYGTVTDES